MEYLEYGAWHLRGGGNGCIYAAEFSSSTLLLCKYASQVQFAMCSPPSFSVFYFVLDI